MAQDESETIAKNFVTDFLLRMTINGKNKMQADLILTFSPSINQLSTRFNSLF
tara:strand:+ start:347 stop:505 length:159 start_codon:yes stop_codon:yes gene_type:complete